MTTLKTAVRETKKTQTHLKSVPRELFGAPWLSINILGGKGGEASASSLSTAIGAVMGTLLETKECRSNPLVNQSFLPLELIQVPFTP